MIISGNVDEVCCFFCNVRIRNWLRRDNPWIVHAMYSRQCNYIKLMKGEYFIEHVHKDQAVVRRRIVSHKSITIWIGFEQQKTNISRNSTEYSTQEQFMIVCIIQYTTHTVPLFHTF